MDFSQIFPILLNLIASTQAKITWRAGKLSSLCHQFLAGVLTFVHASIFSFTQNVIIELHMPFMEPGVLGGKADSFPCSRSSSRASSSTGSCVICPINFYLWSRLSSGLKSVHSTACLIRSCRCFISSLNSECLKLNWFSSGHSIPGSPTIVHETWQQKALCL